VSDNEAESTFIMSPTKSFVSAMGSSRQRRRAMPATESPTSRHAAKADNVEDISSPTRNWSLSPVSYCSQKNMASSSRTHLVPLSKVIKGYFGVMSLKYNYLLLIPLLVICCFELIMLFAYRSW
jgi:hypothetical protein